MASKSCKHHKEHTVVGAAFKVAERALHKDSSAAGGSRWIALGSDMEPLFNLPATHDVFNVVHEAQCAFIRRVPSLLWL